MYSAAAMMAAPRAAPHGQGGGHVPGKEQLLKGHVVGVVLLHQAANALLQGAQAVLHGGSRLGLHHAVVQQAHGAPVRLHHAPAHQRIAGVDA